MQPAGDGAKLVQPEIREVDCRPFQLQVRLIRATKESCECPNEHGGGDAEFERSCPLIIGSSKGLRPLQSASPYCRSRQREGGQDEKHPGMRFMRGCDRLQRSTQARQTCNGEKCRDAGRCCRNATTAALCCAHLFCPCFCLIMYYPLNAGSRRSRVIRVTTDVGAHCRNGSYLWFSSVEVRCGQIYCLRARNSVGAVLGFRKSVDAIRVTTAFLSFVWPGRSYVRHSRACNSGSTMFMVHLLGLPGGIFGCP